MAKNKEQSKRIFKGETFHFVQGAKTKDKARSVASTIRRSGKGLKGPKVRVVPGSFHPFNIYKSKTNRKRAVLKHYSEKKKR